ncbi:MAG TPA: glycosyltransferase family 2 protein [Planctomycetota bacterium]|nr:glycosyltransferase family 2 protein [Planctomycetota bacterium]HRV82766.1 glycosyltransferase family 2 protein [Planctomycetota bacterium]
MLHLSSDLSGPKVTPLKDSELPRLTIVILNWNGRHHLDGCFESLGGADYERAKLDVILVDNGSDDGSQMHMAKTHQWVRVIQNERNLGFAGGCNQGVANANAPDILVFLNNDLRIEPDFLRNLVAPIVRGQAHAAGGLMQSWDGTKIDSAGGGMNFHGIGIMRGYKKPVTPEYEQPRWTLFACGGAMAMRADVYQALGGFDNRFFAYYEDVDLGWRSWVQGYQTCYVPSARCYHHLSSTSRRVPPERLRLLQVRNPMLACLKNYDDANFAKVFPVMLALANRRAFLASGIDREGFRIEKMVGLPKVGRWQDLRRRLRKARAAKQPIDKIGAADLIAIDDVIGDWKHWMGIRAELQAKRKRPDAEILRLFLRPHWCVEGDAAYKNLQADLSERFGLNALFDGLESGEDPPA